MPSAQDFLNKRNQIQQQLDSVNTPFSQTDAGRYFTERLNNFQPLVAEEQSLRAQANQVLPQDIRQYTEARANNPYGNPSSLRMLESTFAKQNNLRGLANTVQGSIQYGQGRVGDLANSALGLLADQRRGLESQYNTANQDYQTASDREFQASEAEKQRAFQREMDRLKASQSSLLSRLSQIRPTSTQVAPTNPGITFTPNEIKQATQQATPQNNFFQNLAGTITSANRAIDNTAPFQWYNQNVVKPISDSFMSNPNARAIFQLFRR